MSKALREEYLIEGYSKEMPVELHEFETYWGGFRSEHEAMIFLRPHATNHKHVFRIVKRVTTVVSEDPLGRNG